MWTAGEKNLTYDQAKKDSKNAKKDFKLVRKSRTPTVDSFYYAST